MSDTVIKVENLSKKYILGHQRQERYTALRDVIADSIKRMGRKFYSLNKSNQEPDITSEEFFALKDVSFEIKQGDQVGIIGRNGAGKSTLLKILSRITEPTSGRVEITGRVASLLEVGSGFHPELTGRENIFLNGAILGMGKTEIKRKFDEIVDFAEIEKFLDTPVKRYSSGMYVRLAFAVAAHLEPEILIVDEVLAVGDAEFQKKCLGKMGEVSRGGRTVLFVSHNIRAINNLCNSGILLKAGSVEYTSNHIEKVIERYNSNLYCISDIDLKNKKDRVGSSELIFTGISLLDKNKNVIHNLICGDYVTIRLEYLSDKLINNITVAIGISSLIGDDKIILSSSSINKVYSITKGKGYFDCEIPKVPLTPGRYLLRVYAQSNMSILDWVKEAMTIMISEGDFYSVGKSVDIAYSNVLVEHTWR